MQAPERINEDKLLLHILKLMSAWLYCQWDLFNRHKGVEFKTIWKTGVSRRECEVVKGILHERRNLEINH